MESDGSRAVGDVDQYAALLTLLWLTKLGSNHCDQLQLKLLQLTFPMTSIFVPPTQQNWQPIVKDFESALGRDSVIQRKEELLVYECDG